MNTHEPKAFNVVDRARSFTHAFRGIGLFIRSTHNAWLQLAYSFVVIVLGFCFHIASGEWLALILSLGMLLVAEATNSAIEVHMDLTSPESHPRARDTKDIAAGAVLIAAFVTLAVSLIIFLPYIIHRL